MIAAPVKQTGALTQPAFARRAFLGGTAAAIGTLSCAAPAWALPDAETQLHRLFDRLWQEQLHRSPELATTTGVDAGPNADLRGKLGDWWRGGRDNWVDWAKGAVRKLEAFDAAALPQTALTNRAVLIDYYGKISRLGARWQFGEAAGGAYSPVAPYAISQLTGPYRVIPELLGQRQVVASTADCEAWLARLAAFAGALDGSTEAFRIDLGAGIVPPVPAIDATLAQLAALRAPAPASSELAAALARKAAAARLPGDWGAKAALMVERVVYPALDRQIAAVRAARERADADAGVWKLRDGREYYADALAFHTGSVLTAAQIHKLGQDRVAQTTAQLETVFGALGLTRGTIAERCAGLARPARWSDSAEGRTALAAAFAAPDPAVPDVRSRAVRYPAYGEGWVLFAERAADEDGFYARNSAGRALYLQARLEQAARSVADTGLHDLGWSRDKAAAALAEATCRTPAAVTGDIARFSVSPGQACTGMVGEAEWLRLRALARRVAGSGFADARFADVIREGRAPFGLLEQIVTRSFTPKRSVLGLRTV